MVKIERTLRGDGAGAVSSDSSIGDCAASTYAPLNSVDVEQSFSQYKVLLRDRVLSLTQENAEFHLITMCIFPDTNNE